MKFPLTSAALNLAENKYAIVQEAKKDWQYYEAKIKASEECTGRLYREYKEGGAWEEHYKTWTDACVPLGKSRSQVDRIIATDKTISAECANVDHKKESAALNQVEQAREEPKAEPKEEEPEKPAVHSADEKPHNNGKALPSKPIDFSGCVIPQQNLSAVERRDEVREVMTCASTLKSLFERIQNQPDSLFLHLKSSGSVQTFMSGAASMFSALRECLPDVVCPECGGKSASCFYCHGTGWICEVRWNRDWVKSNDTAKLGEVHKRAQLKAQYAK